MPSLTSYKHPKDVLEIRRQELKTERSSFDAHWRELAENIRPRRGRFLITDRNKGLKKYNNIINSRATKAYQIAKSGLLAGSVSPARPWFALSTHDPELMEQQEVKVWLHQVELIMNQVFAESNFYGMASDFLGELILFGTACMTHEDDFEDVARFYTHTCGSYTIAQNDRGQVDTLIREFEWPVQRIVQKYGYENCSLAVQRSWDEGNYAKWYPVVHVIQPNQDRDPTSPANFNKPFISLHYEPGNEGVDRDKWLRRSGFDEFPAYVSRWELTGEDIYGTDCPAMTALGDIKSLQLMEKRKAQAIDKMVNPPMRGPSSLRNVPISSLPGGTNLYDEGQGANKLEPVYQVNLRVDELRVDIDAIERRINEAFFVDLFLAISNMEGIQPRNQLDIIQRNEERLLQLGPVLEHLQGEFLDPLINRTFNQGLRAGIYPEPPEAIQETSLRIKYISTLSMAQQSVATQSIERVGQFASSLAQGGWQGALEKFDAQQAVDEYAQAIGVPPSVIVPDDVLEERAAVRAQEAQAEKQLLAAEQAANVAKTASEADTSGDNLLSDQLNE